MNWRHLTDEAIDEGFKRSVADSFVELMKDPSSDGVEKFRRKFEAAKAAYDLIIDALEM